jgi:hypothetical protein
VIFLSFGSVVKASQMPEARRQFFIKVLASLKVGEMNNISISVRRA